MDSHDARHPGPGDERAVKRAPATRRTDLITGFGVAAGLGMALGAGLESEPLLVVLITPQILLILWLLVASANGSRTAIRVHGDELYLETGITRSIAKLDSVERVVISVNAGRVFVKANGAWRYVRLAVAGEQLARPAVLKAELARILEGTSVQGRVEYGKFGTVSPRATLRLHTVDLARWPLQYVAPRPASWWRALTGLGLVVAVALATKHVLSGM